MEKLAEAHIAIFGIGGVGGYVVEALVRSGIGALDLIDNDIVAPSNINRQIIATTKTIDMPKVEAAKLRALNINPRVKIKTIQEFITQDNAGEFDFSGYDYVVDAIDTVSGKLAIIQKAKENNIPVISSMGAGNKMNPAALEVEDISKTSVCPLARVMRGELKKRNIKNVKVVYSKEKPLKPAIQSKEVLPSGKNRIPGSNAFVPPAAGLIIAGEVVKDLINYKNKGEELC